MGGATGIGEGPGDPRKDEWWKWGRALITPAWPAQR